MLRTLGTILLLIGSISAWAADKIQSLNLKVGLWEVTHTTSLTGTPPIPQEMLAKMTPEQRAKFEERMKARAAAPPKTHTEKSCITQKDLDKDTLFSDDDDKSCTTERHLLHKYKARDARGMPGRRNETNRQLQARSCYT